MGDTTMTEVLEVDAEVVVAAAVVTAVVTAVEGEIVEAVIKIMITRIMVINNNNQIKNHLNKKCNVAVEVAVLVVVVEAAEVVVAAAITVIKMATLLENALRGVMMGVTTTVIKQDKNLQAIQNNKMENQRKKN